MNLENVLRQIDPNHRVVCHAAILPPVGFNPTIL